MVICACVRCGMTPMAISAAIIIRIHAIDEMLGTEQTQQRWGKKKKRIRKTLAISAFHSNHAMGSTCLLSIKEREKECILPSLRLPSHPKSGIIIWHEAAIWCWCSFAPHQQYTPQHNSKANRNCHIRESKRDTWSALLWALYFAFQQFDWKPPVFAAIHALCVNT